MPIAPPVLLVAVAPLDPLTDADAVADRPRMRSRMGIPTRSRSRRPASSSSKLRRRPRKKERYDLTHAAHESGASIAPQDYR
jgi:hypothetical protein